MVVLTAHCCIFFLQGATVVIRSPHTNNIAMTSHERHGVSNRQQMDCVPQYFDDVIMNTMVSQITSLTIVYSTVYSGADQRKHQSSASLAFVRGIHRGPVNSPHKGSVTRKMFPFDDVIMLLVFTMIGGCLWWNTWSWRYGPFLFHFHGPLFWDLSRWYLFGRDGILYV